MGRRSRNGSQASCVIYIRIYYRIESNLSMHNISPPPLTPQYSPQDESAHVCTHMQSRILSRIRRWLSLSVSPSHVCVCVCVFCMKREKASLSCAGRCVHMNLSRMKIVPTLARNFQFRTRFRYWRFPFENFFSFIYFFIFDIHIKMSYLHLFFSRCAVCVWNVYAPAAALLCGKLNVTFFTLCVCVFFLIQILKVKLKNIIWFKLCFIGK